MVMRLVWLASREQFKICCRQCGKPLDRSTSRPYPFGVKVNLDKVSKQFSAKKCSQGKPKPKIQKYRKCLQMILKRDSMVSYRLCLKLIMVTFKKFQEPYRELPKRCCPVTRVHAPRHAGMVSLCAGEV